MPRARDDASTHCANGHALTEANAWRRNDGRLICKECKRSNDRKFNRKRVYVRLEVCARGGHKMEGDNIVYKYNKTLNRTCRTCRQCLNAAAERRRLKAIAVTEEAFPKPKKLKKRVPFRYPDSDDDVSRFRRYLAAKRAGQPFPREDAA